MRAEYLVTVRVEVHGRTEADLSYAYACLSEPPDDGHLSLNCTRSGAGGTYSAKPIAVERVYLDTVCASDRKPARPRGRAKGGR